MSREFTVLGFDRFGLACRVAHLLAARPSEALSCAVAAEAGDAYQFIGVLAGHIALQGTADDLLQHAASPSPGPPTVYTVFGFDRCGNFVRADAVKAGHWVNAASAVINAAGGSYDFIAVAEGRHALLLSWNDYRKVEQGGDNVVAVRA